MNKTITASVIASFEHWFELFAPSLRCMCRVASRRLPVLSRTCFRWGRKGERGVMAFKALLAVMSMVLLAGCCANNTHRTGPGRRLPHATMEATTPPPSSGQHSLDDSSRAGVTQSSQEMSDSSTDSRQSASETRHKMHEEEERKLLDGAANDTSESLNEELVTGGPLDDNVTRVVQGTAGVADEERRGGSSINALFTLYSLISYVASANVELKPGIKSEESGIAHITSLYVLYSVVSYVANSDSLDERNGEPSGANTTQASAGVSPRFAAMHREWGKDSGEGSEGYNLWTGYLIIAVSVVAAAILVILTATCMIRHCRRPNTHTVANRVVVRGVGSPSPYF